MAEDAGDYIAVDDFLDCVWMGRPERFVITSYWSVAADKDVITKARAEVLEMAKGKDVSMLTEEATIRGLAFWMFRRLDRAYPQGQVLNGVMVSETARSIIALRKDVVRQ